VSWRERVFGDEDRLGWWLVPIFVAVGLAGAVLAGSLTVVYYGQQVAELRRETAEARETIAGAADEVRAVADEALEAIADESEAFRQRLTLPAEDADRRGVVRLEVDTEVTVQGANAGEPRLAPAPDPDDDGDEGAEGDEGDADDVDDVGEEPADEGEPALPPPPAEERVRVARAASGFVVVRDGEDAFLLTSFSLLADPRRPDVPLDVPVRVLTPDGETTAEVHSWDEERDLLLLRSRLGAIEPLEWRPAEEELAAGDRLVAVGLTASLDLVRVAAELASEGGALLVSDLPALATLEGGPVLDADGRIVGVRTPRARGSGGDPTVVPIRVLCDRLLRSCPP
jgi:S1-C subfamily serine protease